MSIIQILHADHAYFRERFRQMEKMALARKSKRTTTLALTIVKDLRQRHKTHLRWEAEVLFPGLVEAFRKRRVKPKDPLILRHLEEEHRDVGRAIYLLDQELSETPPLPTWTDRFITFRDLFDSHMQREEEHLFPEALKLLTQKELEKMARANGGIGSY
ncbi:MAG: hemerythrin domain-containing protein [Elusimicrobia bacterium]|nr:hemerythrin domain-containing protein [Elusimicrobiota bacterium]